MHVYVHASSLTCVPRSLCVYISINLCTRNPQTTRHASGAIHHTTTDMIDSSQVSLIVLIVSPDMTIALPQAHTPPLPPRQANIPTTRKCFENSVPAPTSVCLTRPQNDRMPTFSAFSAGEVSSADTRYLVVFCRSA